MSATKKISIVSSEQVRIAAYRGKSTVHIDNPEMEDMLKEVSFEDIVTHIQSENASPDEVFTDDQLSAWAEKNGYVKQ